MTEWILALSWVIAQAGAPAAPMIIREPSRAMPSHQACIDSVKSILSQPRADTVTPIPTCYLAEVRRP